MGLRENRLRQLIRKGEPSIGTRILIAWPGLVEIIGHSGVYDYVEFLSEYGPYDLYDLDNLARAAELVNISTMIKIDQEPRIYLAGRALASGIQNILFADIRSVEDAEEAVKAVRTEPKGLSGFRMDRRVGYVSSVATAADVVKICEDAVVALMIEKKSAVENLNEILSVEGVDMVQFGPSDYSISIGLPGEVNHPKVREAEVKVIKTALEMGVTPRAEIRNVDEAKRYIDMGVRNFSIGTDVTILYNWWKSKGGELRQILSRI
ncbi:MAG: aldolase/citrate lyase family protein [Nitrososphaerota archaeon]|nr:aldolase/citrate lyase family protein [Candidatus Bathyarchaeota archaeon]MDW8048646.1 aldolase/citrate lyase family protein [Nitrososphaerota archaeon]